MQQKQNLKYVFILLLFCAIASNAFAQSQTDTISNYNQAATVNATTTESTNSTNDGNFAKRNYSDTLITRRTLQPNQWNNITSDDNFWYSNGEKKLSPKKEEKKEVIKENSFWKDLRIFFNSETFRVIAWILIIVGFAAIVVSYLISNDIIFVKSKARKLNNLSTDEEEISDNIFEIDFETHIAKALAASNYRLAIRLMFLQTIKTMSNKNIIQYAADKTNFDYLMQLSGTKYFSLFSKSSLNYEYTWYGNFEVNEQQFATIKNNIYQLNQSISN